MKNVNFSAQVLNVKGYAAEKKALEDAKAALYNAQHREVKAVTDYLRDNPDQVLTCGQIGRMFGIRPCDAYRVMCDHKTGSGVTDTEVHVTRKFAEVNEAGEIIEGGGIIKKKQTLSGFTAW